MTLEDKMRDDNRKYLWNGITVLLFTIVMAAGLILGILLPIRPEKSELEKRDLTEFPEFSVDALIDGEYTAGIETWYSDTYPLREKLLKAEWSLKSLYGFQTDSINNVGNGDDIPDLDDLLASVGQEQNSQEAPTAASVSENQTVSENQSSAASEQETQGQTVEVNSSAETESPAEQTSQAPQETVNGQELAMMNPQEAGQVNVKNLIGYCVYGFNLGAADQYCLDVATVANALKDKVTVYDILIPDNSAIMLDDETKTAWKLSDEKKVIAYYQGKLDTLTDCAVDVDIYDALMEHNSEYLYFYTDHHWTQLGAYYAYVEYCKKAGLTANPLDAYEQIIMPNFLGSYYATSGYSQLSDNPDTVIAYIPLTTNEFRFFDTYQGTYRNGKIIRDMNEFEPHHKYLSFIYGDNPISYVENPSVKNGKTCIVVKESFGNTFVPFLVDHYEKLIIVDYRDYKESVVQLALDENACDIVFVNNLEAISDKPTMEVLGNICR